MVQRPPQVVVTGYITTVTYLWIDRVGHVQTRTSSFFLHPRWRPARVWIDAKQSTAAPPGTFFDVGGGYCYDRMIQVGGVPVTTQKSREVVTPIWVRSVIAKAIAISPSLCSEPIDILHLTADRGIQWIERGACAAQ